MSVQTDQRSALESDRVFFAARVVLYAKIAALILIFDPRAFDAFGLPKSAVSHGAALVLAALIGWLLLRHGRAFLRWSPLALGAGAVLLTLSLAALFAFDTNVALFGSWRRYLGLTQALDLTFTFLAVMHLVRSPRDQLHLVGVALAASALSLLYAFVQAVGKDPVAFVGASAAPIATMGNPDTAGGYFSIVASAAAAVALLARGADRRLRILSAVIAPLAILGLLATGTRGGYVGLTAGAAAMAAVALASSRASRRTVLLAGVGGLLVLTVVVAISPVGARLDPRRWSNDVGVQVRLEIWGTVARLVAERPILGYGPDNFVALYPSAREERSVALNGPDVLQNSTHSWIAQVLISAGALGLAAMLFFIAQGLLAGLRLARSGALAACAVVPFAAYFGQGLFGVNDIGLEWVPWVAAGVMAGGTAIAVPTRRRRGRQGPSRSWVVLGGPAVAAAVVFSTFAAASRIGASGALNVSETFLGQRSAPNAVPYSVAVVSADWHRPEHWSAYGTALLRSGRPAAASAAFSEATRRAPWEPLFWRNLAATRIQMGDLTGASLAIDRTLRADPFNAGGHDLASRVAFDRGDLERAVSAGKLATRLAPDRVEAYRSPATALVELKRFEEAAELLEAGIRRTEATVLRLYLADVRNAQGRKAEALAIVDQVLAAEPANPDALRLKAALAR